LKRKVERIFFQLKFLEPAPQIFLRGFFSGVYPVFITGLRKEQPFISFCLFLYKPDETGLVGMTLPTHTVIPACLPAILWADPESVCYRHSRWAIRNPSHSVILANEVSPESACIRHSGLTGISHVALFTCHS
jgi:hypothetical protein